MSKTKNGFTLIELPVVRKRGFTLIELLVVMFIIGLLATLVIVNVANARKSGRDAKRVANLKSIQTALEMYNQKFGSYPSTATSITGLDGNTVAGSRSGCDNGWCGLCSAYNTLGTFTSSGITGWIAGLTATDPSLAPEFIPVLPNDPKPKNLNADAAIEGCYLYKSNGTDYMVLAHQTMETVGTNTKDSSNPVSLQEMARQNFTQPSIAVYTPGAVGW